MLNFDRCSTKFSPLSECAHNLPEHKELQVTLQISDINWAISQRGYQLVISKLKIQIDVDNYIGTYFAG